MYTAIVECLFPASHQVRMPDGSWETLHSHDWLVRTHFRRAELDQNDMVVDFCTALEALQIAVAPLKGRTLNELPEFGGRIPTAEALARHLFDRVRALGLTTLARVEVTEAPGCVGAYECAGN